MSEQKAYLIGEMKSMLSKSFILTIAVISLCAGTLHAQWQLKTLSWNIESARSDVETIATYLENLEGYDIIGLSEVDPSDIERLTSAAGIREGAKGDYQSSFSYVIGKTGENTRLAIIWDNIRFELVDGQATELNNLNSAWHGHRSPLFVKLRHRTNSETFLYMVNHLARGDETLRQTQASGLVEWARVQEFPVIASGDFNFDYDIDEGIGNQAYNLMLTDEIWTWVVPQQRIKTQSSTSYNSILDFTFVAQMPENWVKSSEVLLTQEPFINDDLISDHRPIDATFLVYPPIVEEEEPPVEEGTDG